jgi:tetratricopeptide (TPR) repeat protein
MGRGDATAAVQDLRTVLRDQPELVEGHALLGQAHLALGEGTLARESLEKAAALDPRRGDVRRALARLDAMEGHPNDARERLATILKASPKDVETLRLLLDLDVNQQDWPQAERTLARLREAGDAPAVLAMAEGRVHQARKHWDQARAAYERAIAAAPDAPEPLLAVVQVDLASGKPDQAEARLRRLIAARPDHPYAHGILGSVLLAQRDQDAAEREFREASRIKAEWLAPWIDLASLKVAQKKPSEAVSVLEAGLKTHPRSEQLRLLLAGALSDDDRTTDQAIAEYDTILQQNPKSVVAANNLAVLLADRKGDPKSLARALALTKDFERTAPNPLFLDTLGWVYVKLGQANDAVRLLKPVADKAPEEPVVNYHLGMAYHRAGDMGQAKIYLAKALETGRPFSGADETRTILAQIQ